MDTLFATFDRCPRERGYLPMGIQIVGATLVAAPKQRNTKAENEAIKAGKTAAEIWPDEIRGSRHGAEGCRRALDGEVRQGAATARRQARHRHRHPQLWLQEQHCDAGPSASSGRVRSPMQPRSMAACSGTWSPPTTLRSMSGLTPPTAYRSNANEAWLERHGRVSRIHRKKPRGRPMPERTARSNAAKSSIRARVEHVFARQKGQMHLVMRTIGIARATAKVTLANPAYNMDRLVFHERRAAMG
jgi:hypothetical protein